MILHGHDVCSGLAVPFAPPGDVTRRLWVHTSNWMPRLPEVGETADAWSDLLARSGRARPTELRQGLTP
jgi:hypothetical protein